MILYVASLCLLAYCCASLLWNAPPGWRLAGVVLLFVVSAKYVVYKLVGGSFFAPELPRAVILGYEAAYGAFVVLFLLLVCKDVGMLVCRLGAHWGMPLPSLRARTLYGLCALVLSGVLGCWGVWQGTRVPDVHRVVVPVKNLPSQLDGFTLVQLSDLHLGGVFDRAWLDAVVDRTNALAPRMVVPTGDFIDGSVQKLGDEVRPLARITAPKFGVTGNHEYFWGAAAWTEFLRTLGVTMLHNSHEVMDVDGTLLVVAGVNDIAAPRFGEDGPDLTQALAGAPEVTRILLQHQPKNAVANARRVAVQLSGHTHGGLMLFLYPLIERFNAGFVSGLYPLGDAMLYVTPGTGLWGGFACRLGVPSEITCIILCPAASAAE